jgi:hypothetical protein
MHYCYGIDFNPINGCLVLSIWKFPFTWCISISEPSLRNLLKRYPLCTCTGYYPAMDNKPVKMHCNKERRYYNTWKRCIPRNTECLIYVLICPFFKYRNFTISYIKSTCLVSLIPSFCKSALCIVFKHKIFALMTHYMMFFLIYAVRQNNALIWC